jgi:cysteine desulfurase
MAEWQTTAFGNPSSLHFEGRRARRRLEDAREAIADMLGARLSGPQADRLVFTSGGTEANNLALLERTDLPGLGLAFARLEHPSVTAVADALALRGVATLLLPVSGQGVVDASALSQRESPRLLALMLGNHETGVLQPVADAAQICRARGGGVHCDAVQAAGKVEFAFRALGVDTLSVAAHKFHGPTGIGALLVRPGVPLRRLLQGGPQEFELRPGTEAVALAVGMQRALEAWHCQRVEASARLAELRDRFERRLLSAGLGIVIHGSGAPRLPHVANLAFPGRDRQALLVALDLAGIACSAGSACSSGSSAPSPTLLAMGVSEPLVQGSLRFSFGHGNTPEQVDDAAERALAACRRGTC